MKDLFLDVDGTLYSALQARIPESAERAVKLARENGCRVFLCTGRSLSECSAYLNYDVDGYVFSAGSMIYAEHKRIFDRPLPRKDVEEICRLGEKYGFGWCREGAAGAYSDPKGYATLMRYFSGGDRPLEEMRNRITASGSYPMEYEDENEKIYKICFFNHDSEEAFIPMEQALKHPYVMTVTYRDPRFHYCAEVTDGRVTKGTGIARVLEYYGDRKEDAAGFGDSMNDVPMFEACGIGIAMGNAFEEVKKKADWVTTDIDEDGLWNAFRHLGVI